MGRPSLLACVYALIISEPTHKRVNESFDCEKNKLFKVEEFIGANQPQVKINNRGK